MAGTYCLAILAGFCFHSANVSADLQDIGLGYALTIKTPDYEASTSQTDVIRTFDWRREPKACAGDNCVRYHKTCTTEANRMACNYQIAALGQAVGGSIRVSTTSAAEMATAEDEISLWFGSNAPMLSLSSLKTASGGDVLAACPNDIDDKLCNPQ
jgi:hypothetical protein